VIIPDQARLTVEDDGRGFAASEVPKDRYGLIGMNERARILGGSLDIRSSPDGGTRVEATVPLEKV
jgi:signal transduction histidine kinase